MWPRNSYLLSSSAMPPRITRRVVHDGHQIVLPELPAYHLSDTENESDSEDEDYHPKIGSHFFVLLGAYGRKTDDCEDGFVEVFVPLITLPVDEEEAQSSTGPYYGCQFRESEYSRFSFSAGHCHMSISLRYTADPEQWCPEYDDLHRLGVCLHEWRSCDRMAYDEPTKWMPLRSQLRVPGPDNRLIVGVTEYCQFRMDSENNASGDLVPFVNLAFQLKSDAREIMRATPYVEYGVPNGVGDAFFDGYYCIPQFSCYVSPWDPWDSEFEEDQAAGDGFCEGGMYSNMTK